MHQSPHENVPSKIKQHMKVKHRCTPCGKHFTWTRILKVHMELTHMNSSVTLLDEPIARARQLVFSVSLWHREHSVLCVIQPEMFFLLFLWLSLTSFSKFVQKHLKNLEGSCSPHCIPGKVRRIFLSTKQMGESWS